MGKCVGDGMSISQIEAQIARLTRELASLRMAKHRAKQRPVLCLFDLETTGLGKTSQIRICEAGLVEYMGGRVHQWHVNPLQSVSLAAARVHKLKNEFLRLQDPWSKVGKEFNASLEGMREDTSTPIVLGGFNSKRYDSRILTFEHHRHGLHYPANVFFVDFRDIFPQFIRLEGKKGLADYHRSATGKEINSAHTAVADAKAIGNVLDTIEDRGRLRELIEEKMEASEAVIKRCF